MRRMRSIAAILAVAAAVALIAACRTISPYSAQAYEYAVTLKVESIELMGKATEPYEDHAGEVDDLTTRINVAYEHAKGRERNELATRQWEILKDPERRLLGGFLARWEEQGTMSAVFVEEAQGLVSDAFDTIIDLENGRRSDATIVE